MPELWREERRRVHYRYHLHFLPVGEKISPRLDPLSIRCLEIIPLQSAVREIVVKTVSPHYYNVRAEHLYHLKERSFRVSEVFLCRGHTRT